MVDRVYQRNATAAPPAAPDAPSEGYPTNGNPAGAIPATIPGAYWYHMITESLRNVIVAAGLDPDHEDLGQLVAALQAMGLGGYASAADAQALSSLVKILTPGTLDEAFKGGNQSPNHQILPGGIIIQWGLASYLSSDGGDGSVGNFPITFPNECYRIVGGDRGAGINIVSITDISPSQYRCWGKRSNDNEYANTSINFIAIGR